MSLSSLDELKTKHTRLVIKIIIGVLAMFGFCYALVPFYSLICKKEGINGRISGKSSEEILNIDKTRSIEIEFTTTIHGDLAFQFRPLVHHLYIHPGETKQVYFYAENDAKKDMVVQAVPSVAPGEAAKYLKKTQCFCFTQQTLIKNEKVDMPVIFHLDPEIPKDIKLITLNYTLFDATQFVNKQQQMVRGRIEL